MLFRVRFDVAKSGVHHNATLQGAGERISEEERVVCGGKRGVMLSSLWEFLYVRKMLLVLGELV